MAFKTGSVF